MSEKQAKTIETERLRLREATEDDADFALAIYNDPAFVQFVGDRGLRTMDDALEYVRNNFIGSYRTNGFGLMIVERKQDGARIGCCGLVSRPYFDAPDIGFAYLPDYTSQGYGFEAARATLDDASGRMGIQTIQALVSPANVKSIGLIEKLGFTFDRDEVLPGQDSQTKIFSLTTKG